MIFLLASPLNNSINFISFLQIYHALHWLALGITKGELTLIKVKSRFNFVNLVTRGFWWPLKTRILILPWKTSTNYWQSNKLLFILTNPTHGNHPFHRKPKKQRDFSQTEKPLRKKSIDHSTLQFSTQLGEYFSTKSNQHGTQTFQTQSNSWNELSIYLSRRSGNANTTHLPGLYISVESEITSPCPWPGQQLPNNVSDTYIAITQLIAAQHERVSTSGNFALQIPHTPPLSLLSDADDVQVLTPVNGNPTQYVPYTLITALIFFNYAKNYHPIQTHQNFWLLKIVSNLTSPDPTIYRITLRHLTTLFQASPQ